MNSWIRSMVAVASMVVAGGMAPTVYGQVHPPQNLVVNGDFSADGGSLDGWKYNQNVDNYYWQLNPVGTTDYASNGCYGEVCVTGSDLQKNYLYQILPTKPGRYKLSFTYDAGTGGVNELQVLVGGKLVQDIMNAGQGSNTYTVYFEAHHFGTKLNFLGRQDNGFSFLSAVSVTRVHHIGRFNDENE